MSSNKETISLSPLLIQKDIKANCTNSVYIETPSLKLLVALNGPYYSPSKSSNVDESRMDININIKVPSYCNYSQTQCAYNESQLEDILTKHLLIEKYPRTRLDIVIEVFEFKADYFPYAVMGTSLCACYANIEQKGILTCCKVVIDKNGKIIADPTIEKERGCETKFVIGSNISMKENFMFMQDGVCGQDVMKKAIASAIKICEVYQNYIMSKL